MDGGEVAGEVAGSSQSLICVEDGGELTGGHGLAGEAWTFC